MIRTIAAVVVMLAGTVANAQQAGESTATPVLVPARPAQAGVEPTGLQPAHEGPSTFTVDDVMDELIALRADLQRLQQTVDALLADSSERLRRENAQLRGELRRMQAALASGAAPAPSTLIAPSIIPGAPPRPAPAETTIEPEYPESVPSSAGSVPFTIVKEWGRTPEASAEVGPEVSSLKGMIGWVAPGTLEGDLVALGRDLHAQFTQYDNINIDIFDDEAAAKAYAETTTLDAAHRVLSVSKFGKTGRDVILLIKNGAIREVAP